MISSAQVAEADLIKLEQANPVMQVFVSSRWTAEQGLRAQSILYVGTQIQ